MAMRGLVDRLSCCRRGRTAVSRPAPLDRRIKADEVSEAQVTLM
jgi:hypothetical protein